MNIHDVCPDPACPCRTIDLAYDDTDWRALADDLAAVLGAVPFDTYVDVEVERVLARYREARRGTHRTMSNDPNQPTTPRPGQPDPNKPDPNQPPPQR